MAFNNPVPTKLELDGIDKILTTPYIDEDWLPEKNIDSRYFLRGLKDRDSHLT